MFDCCYIRRFLLAVSAFAALLLAGCGSAPADFSIAVFSAAPTIQAGSSRQWSLAVTALNGFQGSVNVSLSGLPSGVTAPANVVLVPGVPLTITLIAANAATVTSSPIVIQGRSGTLVHTIQLNLAVTAPADFSLSAGSPSVTLQAGGASQPFAFTVAAIYGFNAPVTVTLSGVPAGVSATSVPDTATPGAAAPIVFSAQSNAPAGSFTVTVTGTSGSVTHSVPIALIVTPAADFSVSPSPGNITLQAGNANLFSVAATALHGFNQPINITMSGLPAGVSASPTVFSLVPQASQAIELTSTGKATVGDFTLTLTASAGALTHSVSVQVAVTAAADFALSPTPGSITFEAGSATQFSVAATAVNGFDLPINVTVSGLPSGVSASPSAFSLLPGAMQAIQVTSTGNATVGNSNLTLTASAGSLTHSISIGVGVTTAADFTVAPSPGSLTFVAGSATQFSVSAAAVNGFNQPVNVTIGGLPSGVSASPSTFSLLPGAAQVVKVTSTANATVGNATLTLTGSAGPLTNTAALPVLLQPIVTINVAPAAFDLAPGLSQTLTVSASDGNAGQQLISVALQNLPPGIHATPASLSLSLGVAQNIVFIADDSFTADGYGLLGVSIDGVAQTQPLAFHALPIATTMVTNGLLAYFPMDEDTGTTIHDTSGGGYAGTFGGSGDSWTSGGVSLTGSGWIDLTPGLSAAQTIQMWVDVPAGQPAAVQALIGTAGNAGVQTFLWALRGPSLFLTYSGYSGAVSASPLNGSAAVALVEGNSYANSDQYWINDAQVYYVEPYWGAVAGMPIPGHFQIGAGEGGNGLSGKIGPIAFYNRPLSATEVAQNAAFFKQLEQSRNVETQEASNSSQNQFIAMGDSITYGLGASVPFCSILAEPEFNAMCLGFIGQKSSLGVLQAPQFANYYDRQATHNILLNWYMSNDVEAGVANADILQNLQASCTTIKQLYPGWTTLIGTMISRVAISDATRFALNDLVRTQTNSACDGYIDVAADPLLGASGAYANGYFHDQVHPNDAGNQEIAGIVSRYINSVTGATENNPTLQTSSTYTMTTADNYVQAAAVGDSSWTLPECIGLTGKLYTIANQGPGILAMAGSNAEVINGSAIILPNTTGVFQIQLASNANGGCQWARQ